MDLSATLYLCSLGTLLSAVLYIRASAALTRNSQHLLPMYDRPGGDQSVRVPARPRSFLLLILSMKLAVCLSDLTANSAILAPTLIGFVCCLVTVPMLQRGVYLTLVLLLALLAFFSGFTRGWNVVLLEAAGATISLAASVICRRHGRHHEPVGEFVIGLLLQLANAITWSAYAAVQERAAVTISVPHDYAMIVIVGGLLYYAYVRCFMGRMDFSLLRMPSAMDFLRAAADLLVFVHRLSSRIPGRYRQQNIPRWRGWEEPPRFADDGTIPNTADSFLGNIGRSPSTLDGSLHLHPITARSDEQPLRSLERDTEHPHPAAGRHGLEQQPDSPARSSDRASTVSLDPATTSEPGTAGSREQPGEREVDAEQPVTPTSPTLESDTSSSSHTSFPELLQAVMETFSALERYEQPHEAPMDCELESEQPNSSPRVRDDSPTLVLDTSSSERATRRLQVLAKHFVDN